MTDRETFRLAPPVALWWTWLVFVAANAADYAVQGLPSARYGAVLGAVLLLVTGLAYALALRPRVIASGDGITAVNPFRTHVVPWPLVTAVDTGEWVRIHHAPGAADGLSSAGSKTVNCWALYVSGRARRKIAAGPPRARDPLGRPLGPLGLLGLGRGGSRQATGDSAGQTPGYARLPDEARYLASLPPAKAIAVRLDTRADRERARAAGAGELPPRATARWSWTALAAVAIPALALLAVVLA